MPKILKLFPIFLALTLRVSLTQDFAEARQEGEYHLDVNDLLEISIYQEPDLSKILRVAPDGTISYPLLGNIFVKGLTAKEVETKVTQLLAEDYLVNPQVSVFIREHGKISVLGQVRNPGTYELKAGLTLIDAISLAGGFTNEANVGNLKLVRTKEGRKETITIDAKAIFTEGDKEQDMVLEAGDLIIVGELDEENQFVVVLGEVRKPGKYSLKGGLTVIQAIALAGGLTELAAPNATKVIRIEEGVKRTINIPLGKILQGKDQDRDIVLEPNDSIVVPESFF